MHGGEGPEQRLQVRLAATGDLAKQGQDDKASFANL